MKKSFRKFFLSALTFMLLFTAASCATFTADAASKETYLTRSEAMEWLDSTVGTKRGDGQCIAFIKDYYQVLTGYIPVGNACEYAHNALPTGFGWRRIKGEKNLKAGDILIWTGGTGGNGHAAIYGGDGKYYHQKWTGMYVEIIDKAYLNGFPIRRSGSYARYWGVIRPSFRSESIFTEMTDSNYRLKNMGTGSYLTGKSSSGLSANKLITLSSKQQLFSLGEAEFGYTISPLSTSKVVGAAFEEGKALGGVKVNLYKEKDGDDCSWRFQKASGGYVIRNVYNPTLCLTAGKGGKLTVEVYKGNKNQKWKAESVSTVSYDANGGWNNPSSSKIEQGDKHKVSSETPDRIGYKFLGWSETKNAKKASLLSGSLISPDGHTTLYAVWKKNKKYKIDKAELSRRVYTYDGQVKTPAVTVTDTNGNTLREGTDYTLSYSKGRKNVGRYKVTVTYKGKFSGKDKLYFTVVPESTSITGLSFKNGKLTVKYEKQTEKTTGYAIQYSTSRKFSEKSTTTVFVDGVKKTAKAIRDLAENTKWYVRVSAVNETDGKTYYSEWSDVKAVKA
ncbi:MAG: hypothetical protein E7543_05335 [Ruminococcaceae bacterium]|nr:hypothetical protein [Oscillospiraceae bacterium]